MDNNWEIMTLKHIGSFGEQLIKLAMTQHGLETYTPDIDDRGIDFVTRRGNGEFFTVQVKTVRKLNYVFLRKKHFKTTLGNYMALVLLNQGKVPACFLIPMIGNLI